MKDPRAITAPIRPPSGWNARVSWRQADEGETSHRVLHAATIPMTTQRSDYGSDTAERLGPSDALVVLLEFGAAAAQTALFAAQGMPYPTAAQFAPQQLQRTLAGQSGCQRFFTAEGRPFCLYVVLGSHSQRVRLATRVHALLATVELGDGALTLRGVS